MFDIIFRIVTKTKSVFWAVSNCDTKIHREKYALKLQEYIDVDVYSKVNFFK